MAFADVLFPKNISYGSQGGPEFSTSIIASGSKQEQRNRNLARPTWKWNVIYGIKKLSDYQALYNFFLARAGKWQSFRFEDPFDNTLVIAPIAIANGTQTVFQAARIYSSGIDATTHPITKFSSGATVYVNGVATGGATLDPLTGLVTFGAPPAAASIIAVSGTYQFAARFDTDYLPAISDARGAGLELILRIENIPIVEAPGE